jgi:hypothetical protein
MFRSFSSENCHEPTVNIILPVENHFSIRALEDLRKQHARPMRDLAIAGPMGDLMKQIKAQSRRLSGGGQAWAKVVPPQLLERTTVVSLQSGVLKIKVLDSATKFELERWLKQGGQMQVIREAATTINRIKLT